MTGIVTLDVFIGLAFVFLLYSLYASILMEMIATLVKLRSYNLNRALLRLLTDNPDYGVVDFFKGFLPKFLLGKKTNKEPQDLRERIFRHPLLKRTSSSLSGRNPNKIDPANFSLVFIQILKECAGDENIQVRGSMNAIKDLLNEQRGPNPQCRMIEEGTAEMFADLLADVDYDLKEFQSEVAKWYDNSMVNVRQWYKKQAQGVLFGIGFLMAVGFNVNTISIASELATNPEVRLAMVNMATEKLEGLEPIVDRYRNQSDSAKELTEEQVLQRIDEFDSLEQSLSKQIKESNTVMGAGWAYSDTAYLVFKEGCNRINKAYFQKQQLKATSTKGVKYSHQVPTCYYDMYQSSIVSKSKGGKEAIAVFGFWKKLGFVLLQIFNWHNFIGFLITGMAISLGAPFWFDLMKKLVSMKSALTSTGSGKKSNPPANLAKPTAE